MAKNKYDAIAEEWKEEVEKKSIAEINSLIADLAKRQEEVEKQKTEDQDLASIKEKAKEAGAYYREAKKALKQKVTFAIEMLEAKGGK